MTGQKQRHEHPEVRYATVGSRYFSTLSTLMVVAVLVSGIAAGKGVQFGPIITDGAFFLFPVAYIVGDILSEIYGFQATRRAIWTTFLLSILVACLYEIVLLLPGFDDSYGRDKQHALEVVLGAVPQIVAASLLAFLLGQLLNSRIMVRLKARHGEKKLWVRLLGSSGAGEFVDTLIFCFIASPVVGIRSVPEFLNYALVGFVYKVSLQYLLTPVTALCVVWIKKREPSYGKPTGLQQSAAALKERD